MSWGWNLAGAIQCNSNRLNGTGQCALVFIWYLVIETSFFVNKKTAVDFLELPNKIKTS